MRSALLLVAALLLAACGDRQSAAVQDGVLQTGLPGVVTAGGRTGGEVIAAQSASAPAAPAGAASAALAAASAAALEAQQEQLALVQAQDRVAAAWRAGPSGH